MMNYIKNSIQKFKGDALSKAIYDVSKGLLIALIIIIGSTFIPKDFSFYKFIATAYVIKLYWSAIYSILLIIATFLILRLIYLKKYKVLEKDNFTDEITGLKNHKALKAYLKITINDLNTSRISTLSIIMIDIDDFKKFNSTYGHTKADKILKSLGQLLNNDKRATDETFRMFKGDEYVVIAKNTCLSDALKAAERKRDMIENNTFLIKEENFKLTVSCGVTEFKKEEDDIDAFLNRASLALTTAKETKGKNNTKSHY